MASCDRVRRHGGEEPGSGRSREGQRPGFDGHRDAAGRRDLLGRRGCRVVAVRDAAPRVRSLPGVGQGLVNTNAGSETRREWRSCGLRCCMGDGGLLALQSRLAEEGSKPRQGALAEDLVNMNAESEAMMEGVGGLVDCGAGRVMEVVWPSGAAVRTEAPNHHEGRWLMTVVLSVVGKGAAVTASGV